MVLERYDYEVTLISEYEGGDTIRTYHALGCSTPKEARRKAESMNPGYRSFHQVHGGKIFMSFVSYNEVMFSGLIVEDGPFVTIKAQDGATIKATIQSKRVREFAEKGSLITVIGSIGVDGSVIAKHSQITPLTKEEQEEWKSLASNA